MDKNISPVDQDFKKFDEINERNEIIADRIQAEHIKIVDNGELLFEALQDTIDNASENNRFTILDELRQILLANMTSPRQHKTLSMALSLSLSIKAQREVMDKDFLN